MRLGLKRICRRCGREFCLCQFCWHNQEYCSRACAGEARRQGHNSANRKYSKTDKGREKNRERQKRYRSREKNETTVTDQYSTKVEAGVEVSNKATNNPHLCEKCGELIEDFLEEFENEVGLGGFRKKESERSYFSFFRFRQKSGGFLEKH